MLSGIVRSAVASRAVPVGALGFELQHPARVLLPVPAPSLCVCNQMCINCTVVSQARPHKSVNTQLVPHGGRLNRSTVGGGALLPPRCLRSPNPRVPCLWPPPQHFGTYRHLLALVGTCWHFLTLVAQVRDPVLLRGLCALLRARCDSLLLRSAPCIHAQLAPQ